MTTASARGAVAVAACAAALALACSDKARSHPYAARVYESSRDCVDDGTSIDVVDGPPVASTCDPVCLVGPDLEGGTIVAVSTMCSPYPPSFDISGAAAPCARALAAYQRNDTCEADGGSTAPAQGPADGGGPG